MATRAAISPGPRIRRSNHSSAATIPRTSHGATSSIAPPSDGCQPGPRPGLHRKAAEMDRAQVRAGRMVAEHQPPHGRGHAEHPVCPPQDRDVVGDRHRQAQDGGGHRPPSWAVPQPGIDAAEHAVRRPVRRELWQPLAQQAPGQRPLGRADQARDAQAGHEQHKAEDGADEGDRQNGRWPEEPDGEREPRHAQRYPGHRVQQFPPGSPRERRAEQGAHGTAGRARPASGGWPRASLPDPRPRLAAHESSVPAKRLAVRAARLRLSAPPPRRARASPGLPRPRAQGSPLHAPSRQTASQRRC